MKSLRDYAAQYLQGGVDGVELAPRSASLSRRLVEFVTTPSSRVMLRVLGTRAVAPLQRHRARGADRLPLRLHLGSGDSPKAGWVNIDLLGRPVEVAWDLTRRLPFRAGSADALFHEHFLEHLTLAQGLASLQDAYRVLRVGGVIRVGVPDAGAYIQSYMDKGAGVIEDFRPGRPTDLTAMQEIWLNPQHRFLYDETTLRLALSESGFTEVARRLFGESSITPCPDSTERKVETLWMEGIKGLDTSR